MNADSGCYILVALPINMLSIEIVIYVYLLFIDNPVVFVDEGILQLN